MDHPHCLAHLLLPSQVFPGPSFQIALPTILLQIGAIPRTSFQAICECLHYSMKKPTEPAAKFAGHCLHPRQLLQFLWEIASRKCVEEGVGVGVDGRLQNLLDFYEGQTVPLVSGDIVQQDVKNVSAGQLLGYGLASMGNYEKKSLEVFVPFHRQLWLRDLASIAVLRRRISLPQGQFLLDFFVKCRDDERGFLDVDCHLFGEGYDEGLLLVEVVLSRAKGTLSMTASTNLNKTAANLPISLCFPAHKRPTASFKTQQQLASTSSSHFPSTYTLSTSSSNFTLSFTCTFSKASSTTTILSNSSATDCDSMKRSILSGADLKICQMTREGLAGIKFITIRTTYPEITQFGAPSKYRKSLPSNGWAWSSGSSAKNNSQIFGTIVESRSAAIIGILKERVLSLGGPGVTRRSMISMVASGVSMERKAGLLVLSHQTLTSYCKASKTDSLRCQSLRYNLDMRYLSIRIFKQNGRKRPRGGRKKQREIMQVSIGLLKYHHLWMDLSIGLSSSSVFATILSVFRYTSAECIISFKFLVLNSAPSTI